jgi:hypothetical protein
VRVTSKTVIADPGNQVRQRGNRSRLPANKAAQHLNILTDIPVSTCEKLLSGQRGESAETLIALLRSDLGRDVLFALMGDASPDWFTRYRKQLDVNAARRQLAESQRLIERLQQEASE